METPLSLAAWQVPSLSPGIISLLILRLQTQPVEWEALRVFTAKIKEASSGPSWEHREQLPGQNARNHPQNYHTKAI